MSITSRISDRDHQRATRFAVITYAMVIFTFLSIIIIAVVSTMHMESTKTTFHAITVKHPISFIDNTYVDKTPHQQGSHN